MVIYSHGHFEKVQVAIDQKNQTHVLELPYLA
jgi:hypothetical protein